MAGGGRGGGSSLAEVAGEWRGAWGLEAGGKVGGS